MAAPVPEIMDTPLYVISRRTDNVTYMEAGSLSQKEYSFTDNLIL
jgi:hypothetical protein